MDQVHRCLDPAEHGKNQRQENDKDIKKSKIYIICNKTSPIDHLYQLNSVEFLLKQEVGSPQRE